MDYSINYTCTFLIMASQEKNAVKKAYYYNNAIVENSGKLWHLRFSSQLPKSLAVMMYDVKEPKPGNKPKQASHEKDNVDLGVSCIIRMPQVEHKQHLCHGNLIFKL